MRTKKIRTYIGRVFRSRRAYSFAEIAETLGVHIRTVQIWKKEGLKILADKMKPYLVMGQEIRDFLKAKSRSRKRPLQMGEFYCPKCQEPRRSRPDKLIAETTNRRLGRTHKQVLLRGTCESCGQSLLLFSSDRKAAEWQKSGLIFAEPLKVINGIENSSVNTDILKGQKNG